MIILGLGSNIGDQLAYLQAAVDKIKHILDNITLSRIVESLALLPDNAPADWNNAYLNTAVGGTSQLSPAELLVELKSIEQELGRKNRGVWAPREIDIDILAMDDQVIDCPNLSIPHKELLNRDFALLPLVDIVPDWRYPVAGPHQGMTAVSIAQAKGFSMNETLRATALTLNV